MCVLPSDLDERRVGQIEWHKDASRNQIVQVSEVNKEGDKDAEEAIDNDALRHVASTVELSEHLLRGDI